MKEKIELGEYLGDDFYYHHPCSNLTDNLWDNLRYNLGDNLWHNLTENLNYGIKTPI